MSLQIISCPINEINVTKEKEYESTHIPFTRHKKIIDELSKVFEEKTFIFQNTEISEIEKEIKESGLIDLEYLKFLKHAYSSYMKSDMDPSYVSEYDSGLVAYYFNKEPVKNLYKLPYYLRCGFYTGDRETSIFDNTYEFALKSAYNSFLVSKMNLVENSVIYCCNVLPGHHATNKKYNGYCFLNNAAILASLLLKKYDKICILDLDFHHGDGTQKIFENNNQVLTISIHGDPSVSFPFYTGYEDETVIGSNYNLPLDKNIAANSYFECLKKAIKIIIEYKPQILIIPFGADTVISDPQGSFDLCVNDYVTIGNLIKENIRLPIIITQEGGYDINVVANIVVNFMKGILE